MASTISGRPLAGKVAVVTGSGRGIGRSVAKLFAKAGAEAVVVSARSEKDVADSVAEIGTYGRAIGVAGDVGDPAYWDRVRTEVEKLGRWDILVNCAGASGPVAPLAEMSSQDWELVLKTNLTGTYFGCRMAIPYMKAHRSGTIINVSSGLAQRRAQPGLAAYGATKAALVQLSAALAGEVVEDGIEVFSLHPGIVETQMSNQHMTQASQGSAPTFGDRLNTIKMLTPDESARAFLLLASGTASDLKGSFVQFDDPDVIARGNACVEAIDAAWSAGR